MKILSIETATPVAAVALRDDHGVACVEASRDMHHVETLIPTIQSMVAERGWVMAEIDLIIVDIGPGLFTGLRVGVAAARSLAAALGCAIAPVSSLEVLAHESVELTDRWVVIDARRGEVFAQHFLDTMPQGEPCVLSPEALCERAKPGSVIVGDGAQRYREVFEAASLHLCSEPATPSPAVAIDLVLEQGRSGGIALQDIVPLYLRDPDAVANFQVLDRFKR
jgi:tRNA threonylcarbamoyladenosine biosynthesis protein TsaB